MQGCPGINPRCVRKKFKISNNQERIEDEDAENEATDVGDGQRGVTGPSRGGMFSPTPGEGGDKANVPSLILAQHRLIEKT